MKKYFFLAWIAILTISLQLKAQMDERQFYKHKIERYSKTRNAGTVLLGSGLGVTVAGTITLISYLNSFYDSNPYNGKYYLGVYGTALGIDMVIGGIVLTAVGSHNIKKYQAKMNHLSAGVKYNSQMKGIMLVYRF